MARKHHSHERVAENAPDTDALATAPDSDQTAETPELIADSARAEHHEPPIADAPSLANPKQDDAPNVTPSLADVPNVPEPTGLPRPIEGACAFEEAAVSDAPTDNPNCPNGTFDDYIVLRNAADIEKLRGCTRVTVGVSVELEDSSQLRGLESLRVIEGSLSFVGKKCEPYVPCVGANEQLASLNGLQGLRCIGGDLNIDQPDPQHAQPLDLTALDNVREVSGSVSLKLIPGGTPSPLAGLRRVWQNFSSSLGTIPAKLVAVYGRVQGIAVPDTLYEGCSGDHYCRDGVLGCSVEVTTQVELEKLSQCEIALEAIVIESDDVSDLAPLSNLKHTLSWLDIKPKTRGAGRVKTLAALAGLRTAYAIRISDQPELASLDAFSNLLMQWVRPTRLTTHAARPETNLSLPGPGRLRLDNLPALADLRGLAGLQALSELSIQRCPLLEDLSGLEGLLETTSYIELRENARLQSLNGLSSLESIGGIELADNPLLADISALSGLPRISMLELTRLPLLADLTALRGATFADVSITQLPLLKSLDGLEGINARPGGLRLDDNDALEDIRALANLQQLATLTIKGNASLASLAGLESLHRVLFNINIVDNPSLPNVSSACAVTRGCNLDLVP